MIWKIFLETLYPSIEQAFGRVSCFALSEAQESEVSFLSGVSLCNLTFRFQLYSAWQPLPSLLLNA